MKILFYINSICHGGAERVMVNLATAFAKNHQNVVTLVTSSRAPNEYSSSLWVERISLSESLPSNFIRRNYILTTRLRKVVKGRRPDVVVSFMAEPNFRAIIATRGMNVKTIISVRNDPQKEYGSFLTRFLAKHLLPFADGCVFQTEEAKNWFPSRLQKKSKIIFNPVSNVFYQTERHETREETVVTCGRLTKQKNHPLLIWAFHEVVREHPRARLLIYGQGEEKKSLEALIDELALSEHVFLMGVTEEIPKALSEATCFVLSSDYEGLPNALMEALAMGIPCVSTDCPCGGPTMLIENGINGFLVPVGNKDELACAISRILSDEAASTKMGNIAKERARSYQTSKIISAWAKYIAEIVGN